MTSRFDIVSSRKDSTGKTRYTKIGAMFPAREGEGFTIKLDALPLPNDRGEVWISAFVPRERDDTQGRTPARQAASSKPASQPMADYIDDQLPPF